MIEQKITQFLIKPNRFSRPCKHLLAVKGVVIHWTACAGASALQNARYFLSLASQSSSASRYASAHFICGLQGEIVQCIPADEMAYHVGAVQYSDEALKNLSTYPNNCTLGIELCCNERAVIPKETIDSACILSYNLLKKYSLQPSNLYRHYDITGKLCPKPFVDSPLAWQNFCKKVAFYFSSTSEESASTV